MELFFAHGVERQSIFCLDARDSTRTQWRQDPPLRNPFEFRRCCDAVSWHSACSGKKSGHSFLRSGTQIGLRKKFGRAAYIALKGRVVREVGYGLSLEGASAADFVKTKSELDAQKQK
jgi:hypothetical protein